MKRVKEIKKNLKLKDKKLPSQYSQSINQSINQSFI
jgi:hypothetical protein